MEEKNLGILLLSISYLGKKKILKVYTAEAGLVTLMAKSRDLTSPFCIAEWLYRKSEREIHTLVDGTLLDPLSNLRSSYEVLTAAGSIANDLLRSQLPSKPSPLLYELLVAYLRKLPTSPAPQTLAISFRLKLLLHDGLLSLRPHCSHCTEPATILLRGESYCKTHGIGGENFEKDWGLLLLLGHGKQFSLFDQVLVSQSLQERTKSIFQEQIT